MTRDEALEKLRAVARSKDPEEAHLAADVVLLTLIDDEEISAAYDAIKKWYA